MTSRRQARIITISSHVTFPETQESRLYGSFQPALCCRGAYHRTCSSLIRRLIEFLLSDLHVLSTIRFRRTKKKTKNSRYSQVHLPRDQSFSDRRDYRCPSNKGLCLEVCMERIFWSLEVRKTNRVERLFRSSPGTPAGPRGRARQTRAINRDVIALWEPAEMDTPQPSAACEGYAFEGYTPTFFFFLVIYLFFYFYDFISRQTPCCFFFFFFWRTDILARVVCSRASFHFIAQMVFASCSFEEVLAQNSGGRSGGPSEQPIRAYPHASSVLPLEPGRGSTASGFMAICLLPPSLLLFASLCCLAVHNAALPASFFFFFPFLQHVHTFFWAPPQIHSRQIRTASVFPWQFSPSSVFAGSAAHGSTPVPSTQGLGDAQYPIKAA